MVDISIVGDIKAVLTIFNRRIKEQKHEAWMQYVQELKEKYPLTYHQEKLSGPGVVEKIYEMTRGDAIITTCEMPL